VKGIMSKKNKQPNPGQAGPKSEVYEPIVKVLREPLYWLLAAVPLAVVLELAHAPSVGIFIAAGLAIIPLAGLMGRATENLAETLGAGVGGLLNATFGNAAELIIALMLMLRGPHMYDYVKASLTGSIIGNVLLVLGLSILVGGIHHSKQVFNRTAASMGATLLALASIGLLVPTFFFYLVAPAQATGATSDQENLMHLSEEIAGVLAGVYLLSLIFSLRTHQHLFAGPEEEQPTTGEHHQPEWGRTTALMVLLVATALVALMSEFLSGSVEEAAAALGMTPVFVGVIVVAVVGNAAEHSTAVLMAWKNKMDLSFNVAVGSSIQIALFVAPVLVFASLLMGKPMDLHFTPLEVIALISSIAVLALVAQDGESHWMEGVMLLAVYFIFAMAFFYLPPEKEPKKEENPQARVAPRVILEPHGAALSATRPGSMGQVPPVWSSGERGRLDGEKVIA
jgi:Ca2+:H+ antiporter